MAGTHRLPTTAAVVLFFSIVQSTGVTLFASGDDSSPRATASALSSVHNLFDAPIAGAQVRLRLNQNVFATPAPAGLAPVWQDSRALAGRDSVAASSRRGLFWGRDRNQGARTAIVLGTIATIAGAALLVYANRPECSENGAASGCSYGTKVVGGAVASAGLVGIVAGTLTWR
jgi:hypothetical protein